MLLLTLAGCGPIVKTASFSQRPDSVSPGSLLGPFEGQVVDADTQRPLSEALVMCTWAFDRGLGTPAPEAARAYATPTSADGRYVVPRLRSFPTGLTTRLARVSLLVYKKGYVAYRHDQVFGQPRGWTIFSQMDNTIRLARWSPELSHARHLLFLGNGPALDQASDWEVLTAAAELDGSTATRMAITPGLSVPPTTPRPEGGSLLDAGVLLSSDEVRAVTGYEGRFSVERLPGERSGLYDTLHLRALEKPERYDVAIRLWRGPPPTLAEKYEEVLKALPGSKQTDEVGDRSFTATEGEILGLGFLDRNASVVILLTCGRGQCSKAGQLLRLAERVEKNIGRLPSPPRDETSPSEEGGAE